MHVRSSACGGLVFIVVPLALVLLVSCDVRTPAIESDAVRCEQLMQPFVDALWGQDRRTVADTFALPLTVVQQQYDVGDSDLPYVLGSAGTSTVDTQVQAAELLAALATRVSARDDDLVPGPRESKGTAWDATFVEKAGAERLRRCMITLAVGDTEHVLIAGFDRSGDTIRALYWN